MLLIFSTTDYMSRQQIAGVNTIARKYEDRGVETVAVAVDQDPGTVEAFFENRPYEIVMQPGYMVKEEADAIRGVLYRHDSGWNGQVPYLAVIGSDGIVSREFHGTTTKKKLEGAIQDALQK